MQPLVNQLEAILFISGRPLTLAELAEHTEAASEDVSAALDVLAEDLSNRGIRLIRTDASAELVTAPDLSQLVVDFAQTEAATPLSKSSLETLAVIAHRQPVTKAEIDESRGIASDQTLKNLLARGLVEVVGRRLEPGRPPQYGVTTALLRQLGVSSAEDLSMRVHDAH